MCRSSTAVLVLLSERVEIRNQIKCDLILALIFIFRSLKEL